MHVFLLPETEAREDGVGSEIVLGNESGKPLLLTLGITRILEQESLDISIWGSADRDRWRQLTTYPQKFYCGTYLLMLDLSRHPEVRFLRAQWRMSRWGVGDFAALAGFYLSAEEANLHAARA
jgi:hypothetical protein